MDLSIIIPVFNVEEYLENCLNSIYSIEGINKEIIIVNDGSTDGSQKIIDTYKNRYPEETKVIIQQNKGLSGARNAGLDLAKGKYISFIDSDDYIDWKKYYELFENGKEEDLDIIFGELKYLGDDGAYITKDMERRRKKLSKLNICTGIDFWEKSFEKNNDSIRVEVVTNFYKREMLQNNKLFFKEGLLHEDTLFMFMTIFYAKKVKYFPIDFYFYRIREGSIMSALNYKNCIHKMYIAGQLQEFKEKNNINLYSWDSIIFALYFGAVRKYKVKNTELYDKIRLNNKLTNKCKIKKCIIKFLNFKLKNITIKI
ncbi:Glycosyltransferase involved in cell wall bisynthesis [Clostridium cavendishii DSM 21758]|uniref:Glycosyltransferase involved in cell wall bisynthesis n=1 Tax=Clostridium cavendishii DSM 21758 TaxID=1121302 RepID=A0A1M6QE84_9CLOT|nr:glycosyltransferase [Clostridium cavendishii]SHK18373.1 Glycosyltransferase involved in cell wall bisynthesis [Clostridium cavendishii DSM 21758]